MLYCLAFFGLIVCDPEVIMSPAQAQTYGLVQWGQQQATSTPNIVIFDGVANVAIGQLNTTTHVWTPVLPSPLVLAGGLTVTGTTSLQTLNVSGVSTLSGQLINPALPGLSTSVIYPSAFAGPASFGLALPSAATPWVIAGTATSPATDNAGGIFYTALTENQAGISVTISQSSPAVVSATASNMVAGNVVSFEGVLGSPLVADNVYYVCSAGLTANSFEISTTSNCAAAINTTGASSGVTMATNKGLPGTSPSAYHFVQINNGSIGNSIGSLGYAANSNRMASQPIGVASAIGAEGIGICLVANCSATWGGLHAVYDTGNLSNPPNPTIGQEVDLYAQGTDSSQNRVGWQLSLTKYPAGGAALTVGTGMLIGGNATVNNLIVTGASLAVVNGINFTATTFTGAPISTPGFIVGALGDVTTRTTKVGTFTIAQVLSITCTGGTGRGTEGFVSDTVGNAAATYGGLVQGGGASAVNALAVCDGSNWRYQ